MRVRFNRAAPLAALAAMSATVLADLTPYSQDFESLNAASPTALADDGWVVYGNVFTSGGTWVYGYGTFPAPNPGAGFSAIATGEGGAEQGLQYLNTYSDYNNADHNGGLTIESNVFQERIVGAADLGKSFTFSFDYKASSQFGPSGQTRTRAFIKVLDPSNQWALVAFPVVETTGASLNDWATDSISIQIDGAWTGHVLQFGFLSTATLYQPSGVYYDNIGFAQATPAVTATVAFTGYSGPRTLPTPVTFTFLAPGTENVVATSTVPANGDGTYTLVAPGPGPFDIATNPGTWLRRKVQNVTSGGSATFTLVNGDILDSGAVDLDDFLVLAANYEANVGDPGVDPNADLNYDGVVNLDDFLILAANYEVSGD